MSQANVEIAREALEAVGRNDLDGFVALIHPEVTFNSLVTEADEALYTGHDGVRRWFASVKETLGDFRTDAELIQDAGDNGVLTKLVLRGAVRGAEVTQVVWQTVTFRDGKISGWTIHRSQAAALAAAGLSE